MVQWLAFATLDFLRLAVGPKLEAALDAALFRPSLFTIGLVTSVLSAVTILLPTLVRVMVRNQQDGEGTRDTELPLHTPHLFWTRHVPHY